MPKFVQIQGIEKTHLEQMGFSWHKDEDGEYIVRDKLIQVTHKEADAYVNAANAIYKMYEVGAQYVIDNNLFEALDIPPSLIEPIKKSWINERDNHLYGRFDLSGGIDGKEIKLIEFNADTPTLLLETAVIQWMILESSNLTNPQQFNKIYESISKKFKNISLSKKADFSKFLFSSIKNVDEESETTKLLLNMAKDAGLLTHFSYLEDIGFLDDKVVDELENTYDFWFKLYPWEEMLEPQDGLTTSILNPAFTLLYQSKGMLAILYELFPDSPYLLKTSFEPIKEKYVKKRMFGREGANIDIVENGKVLKHTDGIYEEYKAVYQEYVSFVKDSDANHYQAGVFYSDGACGLGFRRGAEILDDMSQFIGHIIKS
ncbi:Similarity with glutathionylspermidine synthase, group 2 [hydrothermal vent metagenome]|uniref:Similarity with glutathionylspermidine synthase, group 2 n=1 Tax=hydrothermal vent metagenome TaxID=652676 RepID=A0A1W1CKW7_9ZZZZ